MACEEQFVNSLKTLGYNAVRVPRANINPLQVLAQEGKATTAVLGTWMTSSSRARPARSLTLRETSLLSTSRDSAPVRLTLVSVSPC